MKIQIEINCDNAAFDENYNEISDILFRLADRYLKSGHLPDRILDSNGNQCGNIYEGE